MRRGRECSGSDNTPACVREGGGKGAATPVKLDEGMRIVCKEKDGEFRRQAHLLQQFLSRGTGLALDGAGGTGIIRVVKDAP